MKRLLDALRNSTRAFRRLAARERAFQQELAVFVISLPVAWWISGSWREYALLVGSILFLILVEVLNSAIEAACDAVSSEFDANIQLAKDCGSLAVLISLLMVAAIWLFAVIDFVGGLPF